MRLPEPETVVWTERDGLPSRHTRFLEVAGDSMWVGTWQGLARLQYANGRWMVAPDAFPDQPPSGPFFANLGGFLIALMFGFTGLRVGADDPDSWPTRPVVLPAGWRSIEIERAWIRMQPARIVARQGMARTAISFEGSAKRRAA